MFLLNVSKDTEFKKQIIPQKFIKITLRKIDQMMQDIVR